MCDLRTHKRSLFRKAPTIKSQNRPHIVDYTELVTTFWRSLTFYREHNFYYAIVIWGDAHPIRVHWHDENQKEIAYPVWAPSIDLLQEIASQPWELF